jgi:hypothetical protein
MAVIDDWIFLDKEDVAFATHAFRLFLISSDSVEEVPKSADRAWIASQASVIDEATARQLSGFKGDLVSALNAAW